MRYTLLFLLLTAILFSCQQYISHPEISNRVIFKESPLDSVYSELRPEIQQFSIPTNEPNKITAKKGTTVFIPANAFVDEFGKPVLGNVEVAVTEVFEMEDFITSGLATMSNGQLLISNGMMNIDASTDGKPIGLKEGKEISIQMPTKKNNTGFQMFVGDGQNWEIDTTEIGSDYLIPIPLDLLYNNGDPLLYFSESAHYLFSNLDSSGISYLDKKYENTIIATQEFQYRFHILFFMGQNVGFLENRDSYLGKGEGWNYNLDYFKIYFDNPNEPIEKLDKLAKQKYIQFYNDHEAEFESFFKEYNQYSEKIAHSWGRRLIQNKERYMKILDKFPIIEKGKAKTIDDRGVDLDSKNASNELAEKGVEAKEVDDILSYHFKRKRIIEKIEKEIKLREGREVVKEFLETTVFSVKKLGWINCDRFYNDANAKASKIIVSNSSEVQLDFIDFSLVIPNLNARLMSFVNDAESYSFTKKEGPYTKLPVGQKAIIVGVSIQDDEVFYASKEIEIQEKLSVSVEMKPISKEELKSSLSTLF